MPQYTLVVPHAANQITADVPISAVLDNMPIALSDVAFGRKADDQSGLRMTTSEGTTLVIKREGAAKCESLQDFGKRANIISKNEMLEVRDDAGSHLARKERKPDEWDLPVEP
jgi:hypothetical protein